MTTGVGIVSVGVAAPNTTGTPPVVQTTPPIDFPNPAPARYPIELRTWLQSLPLNLSGQDTFYGGAGMGAKAFDHPNPRGYIPAIDLKTWVQPTPLNLVGRDQFYGVGGPTYDWPNPRGPVGSIELRSWIVASPALRVFTPSYYGGGYPNYDFPNPKGPRRGIDLYGWTSALNLELFTYPGLPALSFSSERAAFTAFASDSPSGQGWKGPGYMAKYEIDTSVQINGSFVNSLTGAYADPTGVTLFVLDPNGLKSTYSYTGQASSPIVRDSQGHYHFTVTASISGTWTYKWQATGSVIATSPDTTFVVNASTLIAG